MRIKKAGLEDLKEIKYLSKKYNFEIKRKWKELITDKDKSLFILLENKKIIGFSGIMKFDWNNTAQIANVFVLPNYRKKGLASKLINYVIKKAEKMKVRCLFAEAPSLNRIKTIYEKIGFRKCGYNDRYYSNKGKEICIWMSIDF